MITNFNIHKQPNPFDKDSKEMYPQKPVFKLTKELQFYLVYTFSFLFLLYFSRAFFNNEGLMVLGNMLITIDDLFMIFIFSLSNLYLISFLFKYIIIKWNLNPEIKYGHLLTKQPLELFDMSLVYIEVTISYKDDSILAGNKNYIDMIKEQLYSEDIYFTSDNKTINFDIEFKNIENYKCQKQEIYLTYRELITNYRRYGLDKIISQKKLENIVKSNGLTINKEFCIKLHYIENREDEKYDVIVSNNYIFDNFEFDSKLFWSITITILFISFQIYDEIFINTEQTYFTLLYKSIQYNIFFYVILFLIQKRYLYR